MEQHHPVPNLDHKLAAFARALGVMQTLRKDCPWDAKQTNESIRQNSIEEVYELGEALIKGDPNEIKKECGDVLEQIFFYAMFGEEKGQFDFADICNAMCDKLVFRHPHVFNPDGSLISQVGVRGGEDVNNADDVSKLWEVVKQKEKGGNKTILSGQREDVWQKVKEEISEFEAEVGNMDRERAEREFGDLLFSLINAARLYKIKPDNALEKTNQKFLRRFTYVETEAKKQGRLLNDMTLAEMDALWDEAKAKGI